MTVSKITFFKNLPVEQIQSVFQKNLTQPLLQTVCLENFISQHNIVDTLTVDINCYQIPNKSHEFIVFVVNPSNFISLQQLDHKIKELSIWAKKYYYIAVNKFLVFSEVDNLTVESTVDWDEALLFHWQNLVGKTVLLSQSRSDDCGLLGNFIHPVTFIAWKMHE